MRTRDEHLEGCKRRALEYLDRGECANAITSMLSDLSKHPETKGAGEHMALLGMHYIVHKVSPQECRDFIKGFR
jgi:hypothetical protein